MNAMRYENSVPLGYEGDTDSDSSNNDDSGDDQSVDEIEEEYPVEQRNREPSSPLTMRVAGRKRLHDKSTSRPRSSASLRPMHPDIDWTTTTHLATKRQKLTPSLTPASTKPPVSMYAMSQLLNDYFHQQKFEVKSTFGSEGTPSEMTECSGAPAPPQVLHVRSYMPIQIEEALRFSSAQRGSYECFLCSHAGGNNITSNLGSQSEGRCLSYVCRPPRYNVPRASQRRAGKGSFLFGRVQCRYRYAPEASVCSRYTGSNDWMNRSMSALPFHSKRHQEEEVVYFFRSLAGAKPSRKYDSSYLNRLSI